MSEEPENFFKAGFTSLCPAWVAVIGMAGFEPLNFDYS
jgi:hypothetical protein